MTPPETGVVDWHPGIHSPGIAHLAIVGQTPRKTQRHGHRFVWAVCAITVQVDGGTDGCTARCLKCLAWFEQHSAPEDAERPPAPSA